VSEALFQFHGLGVNVCIILCPCLAEELDQMRVSKAIKALDVHRQRFSMGLLYLLGEPYVYSPQLNFLLCTRRHVRIG